MGSSTEVCRHRRLSGEEMTSQKGVVTALARESRWRAERRGAAGGPTAPGWILGGRAARLRLASLRICSPNCAELRTHGPRRGPECGDTRTGRRMRLERRGETATTRGWEVSHLTSRDRGLGTSGASATSTRRRSRSRKAWLQGAIPTLDGPCEPPQTQSRGCWLPSSGSLGSTPGLDGRLGLS